MEIVSDAQEHLSTEEQALKELMAEANEDDRPLFLKYQLPELEGITDEQERLKIELGLRPDVPDQDAYERVPVDQYGEAILRGMGWEPGRPIGRNADQPVQVYEPKKRQHRLGLGAEPKPMELDPRKRLSAKERARLEKEHNARGLYTGVLVSVHGSYDGLYAVILQLGADHAIVRFQSEGNALVPISDLTTVDVKTLTRNHPALKFWRLNKDARLPEVDNHEDTQTGNKDMQDLPAEIDRYGLIKSEEPQRTPDKTNGTSSSKSNKHKKSESPKPKSSKSKKSKKSKPPPKPDKLWVIPEIHVRFRNKTSKHGKQYSKKGRVVDILSGNKCTVLLDGSSILLEDVDQYDLETVLPKVGGKVMVVNSQYRGNTGKLLSKSFDKDVAVVQFADDLSVHKFVLDDVAEYYGTSDLD